MRAGQVLAFCIEQATDQHVLAIRGEIQRHALPVVTRGIALEPAGCLETADDLGATRLDGLDRLRQFLGLRHGQGQQADAGQQVG